MPDRIKILCVDDEKNVLKALRRVFMQEEKYEILLAESGSEGLEVLRAVEGIRMVISDYRMPGMNGVEFLRQVNEGWPDTIRIVLSGYADTSVVVEAVNLGHIYKFIPKPWDDSEMLMTISMGLKHQDLRRENTALNLRLQRSNEELKQKNQQLTRMNDTLEDLVIQRTHDLLLRNRVLQLSQGILDVLPIAVFGIDTENYVVHANEYACRLFPGAGSGPLGLPRAEVFPETINRLIGNPAASDHPETTVEVDKRPFCCCIRRLDDMLSEGIVLALIPADASAGRVS